MPINDLEPQSAIQSIALCLLAIAVSHLSSVEGQTGVGKTTRYWDCCKPSCSWKDNISNMAKGPVQTCDLKGKPLTDLNAQSGCNGGSAYMCAKQQPRVVNKNLAYGFVAGKIPGKNLKDLCCSCFELTFPKEPKLKGKKMIVQVTNTGEDLSNEGQFDIQIPGGGVGIFNGCKTQYNAPQQGWGDIYGGIHIQNECKTLPKELQPGCNFRYTWFANANNPEMNYKRVKCPADLVKDTGCQRKDDPQH